MTADIHTNSGEAQAQRLERVYEQLSRLLHHPDVVQRLRTAPGEHEWSALQVIGPYCMTWMCANWPNVR
jgi:hypothetical protein